jgi:hypothetical protein
MKDLFVFVLVLKHGLAVMFALSVFGGACGLSALAGWLEAKCEASLEAEDDRVL